jgi:anti-anti-sigma regulatory factor
MNNPTSNRPAPGEDKDLGPLTLARDGDHWRFTITSPNEVMLELPPDYERFLTKALDRLERASREVQIEMDLGNLPGLSSRQLGLMLALQKALADHCERLPLTGVSPGVRQLLNITRTDRFFDLG